METISIIANSIWENLENATLSCSFAGFDNRLRHILRLHCLDMAVIEFHD